MEWGKRLRWAIAAGCCLAAAVPATAEQNFFNPYIALSLGYTDNVTFQGEGSAAKSDIARLIEIEVPYERQTRRSNLRLSYRLRNFRYQDFTFLDRDDQRFDLGWNSKLSRRNRLSFNTSYRKTQEQGSPDQSTDPDLNLTRRAEREFGQLNLTFSRKESERWDWNVFARVRALRQTPLFETEPSEQDFAFEGRITYEIGAEGLHRLSDTASLGPRYQYVLFDLEFSGETDSNQLELAYTKLVARRFSLEAAVGVSRNTQESLGTEDETTITIGEEKTVPLAELFLTRGYEHFQLRFELWHRPTAGGSIDGTAISTVVGLTLRSTGRRPVWRWRVSPRFTRRKPLFDDTGQRTFNTVALRTSVERRLGWRFGVRLRADWYDQGFGSDEGNTDSIARGDLGILWYPWGATQLGGRRR